MEYSWLPRGRSYSIINNIFIGKANLILGTMNNSDWIAMIHSETGDSLKFWLFLKVLEKVWLTRRREISLNLTILVDNVTIHTSKLLNPYVKVWIFYYDLHLLIDQKSLQSSKFFVPWSLNWSPVNAKVQTTLGRYKDWLTLQTEWENCWARHGWEHGLMFVRKWREQ